MYSYNSNHKLIVVIIVILWTLFHFKSNDNSGKYYDNGKVKQSGKAVKAKNHGDWVWYYKNGNKKMQGKFKNGKRDGIWTTWDKNGYKLTEGYYEKDKLNGDFKRWENNKLLLHFRYVDDKLTTRIFE